MSDQILNEKWNSYNTIKEVKNWVVRFGFKKIEFDRICNELNRWIYYENS